MGCGVTVLRTTRVGAFATKRYAWNRATNAWIKTAYTMGKLFNLEQHAVHDINSLAEVIETIRRDSTAFIIRGQPAPGRSAAAPVNRRYLHRPGSPDPDFIDVPRAWLMADIDGYPIPEQLDLADDTVVLIERAIADLLPPEFHDVRAFWQLSASAGFAEGTLRAHVWFYLDRPVETSILKAYMSLKARGIDRALFNPVQIHYVADPIVEGRPDPIIDRTGWIEGEADVVVLPDLDAATLSEQSRQARRDAAAAAGFSTSQATTLDGALAVLGDGEGLDGFHEPLRRAAWLYALQTPTWARSLIALKDRMRTAIMGAPVDRTKRSGVGEYLSDHYLDRLASGAFEKVPNVAGWERCTPEHPMPTGDAEQARNRMQGAIEQFLSQNTTAPSPLALTFNPDLKPTPRRGLVVAEVGLGKSEAALRSIARFVARAKASGQPHRVAYFVPEHRLGADLLGRANALGISAATFYGRAYIPPGQKRMCDDIEAVKLAEAVHADVSKFVCGPPIPKNGEACCEFRFRCAYQAQKIAVAHADMIVLAQATMYSTLPPEVAADLGLVVVDEAFWQTGIGQSSISIETFSQDPLVHSVLARDPYAGHQVTDEERTNELHEIRARIERTFASSSDGYLLRRHVEEAGLTPEQCTTAGSLEWRRQRDVAMWPGMPWADRKTAAEAIAVNGQLPRLHAFWMAVRELLENTDDATGRVELQMQQRASGSQRVALLNTRRDFVSRVLDCPILLLDGTADVEIVRHYLPDVELLAEERPAAPHVTVHQVIGPLSKTSLTNRPGLVAEVRDYLLLKTQNKPSLLVTHLGLEEAFAAMPNTELAHFGAIAGRDAWKHVRHLAVVGRPQPAPDDVRTMAAQLTGRPVPLADPVRGTRGATMSDGSGIGIEVSRFDDPDAEATRAAVTDAAVIQAVGRGRGINRTESNPLDVWIMGNVITPWPVADLANWKDVALDPVMRMTARGLVLFSPADAHAVHPDLFVSAKAAQHSLSRSGISAPTPYVKNNIRGWGGNQLFSVAYRPTGRGQQSRRALVAEDRLTTLATLLSDRLGMPVQVESCPPDPPPAPAPKHSASVPQLAVEQHPALPATPPNQPSPIPRSTIMSCDTPSHPEVPAYTTPAGKSLIHCPMCGEQHVHGGFGHRSSHCVDQRKRGAGYVLVDAGPAPAWMLRRDLPPPAATISTGARP